MDKILIIGYKVSQHFNLPSNLISGFVQLTLLHIHTYFAYTRGVYTYTPYMHIQDVHIHMCIYKRCIYRIYRGDFFLNKSHNNFSSSSCMPFILPLSPVPNNFGRLFSLLKFW